MNTEALTSALNAMLTYFGMDEDEWSRPVFDQARAALAASATPGSDELTRAVVWQHLKPVIADPALRDAVTTSVLALLDSVTKITPSAQSDY